mgnify:CR=1 FL=1
MSDTNIIVKSGIKDLEEYFKYINKKYGIPVEINEKQNGEFLEVSIPYIAFKRKFMDTVDAVDDNVTVDQNTKIRFIGQDAIVVYRYSPEIRTWEEKVRASIFTARIVRADLKNGKYTVVFKNDSCDEDCD